MGGFSIDYSAAIEGNARIYRNALEKEFAAKFRADKYEKFKDNGGFGMILDAVQVGLDGLGIAIPRIGDICDGINGVIYLLRGDGTGAVISFVAMIPIAGIAATGGKYLDNIGGLGKRGSDIVYGIGKAGKAYLQRCDATVKRVLADALKKGKNQIF